VEYAFGRRVYILILHGEEKPKITNDMMKGEGAKEI
jgi:hypothetical protein